MPKRAPALDLDSTFILEWLAQTTVQSLQCSQQSYFFSYKASPISHRKKALYFSSCFDNRAGAEFFPSPEDVHKCRLHFTADKWTTGLKGLFQLYNKMSCQGWSIYAWWTIQLDSEDIDKKAVFPAHMLLCFHLYCQPLVTLQCPDHLYPRTGQEISFQPP